ncbi:serine/threonine-protein kinase [Clostridium septicum]|uniref:Protein kinase n=2 Tax=Clostridium septicum TaxID=1504 RepID=A0A9N7JJS8_CLOSE|nr:serine/threonine-protein kinase [Clostridium septicum]AYE33670.1 protein kinase [Clostridium septicum]MDU1315135.1 serine/threonine-protein kinase [Clostridium septicum]UEC21719.1 serine/threonine-protein kinase [Clostridium septicum]USS00229.1 serine/threonine-protein kinase [Clostridium septicum]
MVRTYAYSANLDKETEKLFRSAEFLGEGHNGIVYELPGNRAIKIFQQSKCCMDEGRVLKRVSKSKFFPNVYSVGNHYIVREKIGGERLDHYIKKNGLSYKLCKNLFDLIKEFKHLRFTKLDARCRDIYVLDDETVRVIDPKQCYTKKVTYPRHLMKGFKKIDCLDEFLENIKAIDKKIGQEWETRINKYFYDNERE